MMCVRITVTSLISGGCLLLAVAAAAQERQPGPRAAAAATTSAPETSPRTPWGEPDLQGIWRNPVVTPLERPREFGTRQFLTDQEVTDLERQLAEEVARRRAGEVGRDHRAEPGSEADVAGAYNEHWFGDPATRRGRRTSQVIDPPEGRIPPLTAEAERRIAMRREYQQALLQGTSRGRPGPPSPRRLEPPPDYNLDRLNRADGPEDRGAPERCLGDNANLGLPHLLRPGTFGGVQLIVQAPGAVAIYYDIGQGQGFARIIQIANRPPLPSHIRLRHGDALARWEGDTLVVEISNFTNQTDYRGSRENLHLVERYRRVDPNTLTYEVTVSDPTTWTAVLDLAKADDNTVVLEGACHEGNFGLTGILTGARAAEKAFEEGRGPDPATLRW